MSAKDSTQAHRAEESNHPPFLLAVALILEIVIALTLYLEHRSSASLAVPAIHPIVQPTPSASSVQSKPTASSSPDTTPLPTETRYQTSGGLRFADRDTYQKELSSAQTMVGATGVLTNFLGQYGVSLWTTSGNLDPSTNPITTWGHLNSADPADLANLKTFGLWFIDEWSKYPKAWVSLSKLQTVVFAKNLKSNGSTEGGDDPSPGGVLFIQVAPLGSTSELYLREIIHHEFDHQIEYGLFASPDRIDTQWTAFNPSGFSYHAGDLNAEHPMEGFVSQYAETSIGEDKAETYAYLFVDSLSKKLAIWEHADLVLRGKVVYYKGFIKSKVPIMDDAYFAAINP